jgi:nitroimidazol reductase NimA-like FMN-containing flavoprotein (pyridoxamine 5'-phosphate oxidase superfamily)
MSRVSEKDPSAADGPPMTAAQVEAFLARPMIARLATSLDDRPRILPMWYRWDGSALWMETSPTFRNYRIIKQNPRVAVAIDESLGGLHLRAILMGGRVEIIEEPEDFVQAGVRRIYQRYLDADEMRELGEEMLTGARHVLICLRPATMKTWDSVDPAG